MMRDIRLYFQLIVFIFVASQILLFVPYIQSDGPLREQFLTSSLLESMRQSLWFGFANVACIAVCLPTLLDLIWGLTSKDTFGGWQFIAMMLAIVVPSITAFVASYGPISSLSLYCFIASYVFQGK